MIDIETEIDLFVVEHDVSFDDRPNSAVVDGIGEFLHRLSKTVHDGVACSSSFGVTSQDINVLQKVCFGHGNQTSRYKYLVEFNSYSFQ